MLFDNIHLHEPWPLLQKRVKRPFLEKGSLPIDLLGRPAHGLQEGTLLYEHTLLVLVEKGRG